METRRVSGGNGPRASCFLKPDPKDNEPLGESEPCGRAR